ncbi:hypothetical protein [Streptomyces sp. NBC_01092]|uniref:hypothetical protein n=1 Tax=Streptomyces sp. NBC_01092 TaxID=2903748 RepID=UPI0038631934|nr:hypothetical protein OG254_48955 [Streptomyces sp. NBC_01092]
MTVSGSPHLWIPRVTACRFLRRFAALCALLRPTRTPELALSPRVWAVLDRTGVIHDRGRWQLGAVLPVRSICRRPECP